MISNSLMPTVVLALAVIAPRMAVASDQPSRNLTGEVKPVIYVTDVEESAPFYRDVLGFGFDGYAGDDSDPYYAEMLADRLKFGLHEPTRPGDEERIGKIRLYFRVRDLDAQYKLVRQQRGSVSEIVRHTWMDYFSVQDPDGNEIVFAVTDPERHTSQPWRQEE